MGNLITNLEHSEIERAKRDAIVSIKASLKRQNAIAILKELYAIESITKEEYERDLKLLLTNEGFKI